MLPWPRQHKAHLSCGLLLRLQNTAVYWICLEPTIRGSNTSGRKLKCIPNV